MPAINYIKSRFNLQLAGLVAAVIAINLPMMFAFYIPLLDTSHSFRVFYIFYNDIYTNDSIPQWLPHVVMGSSSTPYIGHISPPGFLAMGLGLLFRVENAYTLFVAGLIGEQLIFLTGMYLLCKLFFQRDTTVVFVCLSAICGIVIQHQVMLNFRAYYLVPMVFYLLVLFVTSQQWMFLLSSAIVFLFFFSGMPGYAVPVFLMICTVFFMTYFLLQRMPLRGYFRAWPKRDILIAFILLGTFSALLISYYYYFANMMNNRVMMSFGRNPADFTVNLESFLVYGGHTSPWKFLDFLYPSHLIATDSYSLERTNFVGVLAIPFAIYGLIWGSKPFFRAISASGIVIALFSIGSATPIASALYASFPYMKTFRHIGFMSCHLNFILPFLAGVGVERLLDWSESVSEDRRRIMLTSLTVAVVAVIVYELLIYRYFFIKSWERYPSSAMIMFGLLVLAAVTASSALIWQKRTPFALAFMLVLGISAETFMYQINTAWMYMHTTINAYKEHFEYFGYYDEAVRVNKYSYQEMRTLTPPRGRYDYAFGFFGPTTISFADDLAYLQWDACASEFRMDIVNAHVKKLIEMNLKNGKIENIDDFKKIIACEYPKLRVLDNVTVAKNPEHADMIIKNSGNLGEVPVILSVAGTYSSESEEDEDSETGDISPAAVAPAWNNDFTDMSQYKYNNSAKVTYFSANRVEAEAYTDNPKGAWLYYADAWNPRWKATVNGGESEIFRANKAFKAVLLPHGKSRVVFEFRYTYRLMQQTIIAGFCIVFTLIVLGVIVRLLFKNPASAKQ